MPETDVIQTLPAADAAAAEIVPPEDYADYKHWHATDELPAAPDAAAVTERASDAQTVTPPAEIAAAPEPAKDPEQIDENDPDAAKRKGGFQRKIDKLTRERHELNNRVAELERTLAAGADGAKPADAVAPAAAVTQPANAEPKPEDFETYEEWVKTWNRWDRQRETAVAAQDEQRSEIAESWKAQQEAARLVYDDFDAITDTDVPVSAAMEAVVLHSERGADLAYWLGSNPEESERISQLAPLAAAKELGRIEASLLPEAPAREAKTADAAEVTHAAETPPPAPKPKPKVTNAPPPIKPLGRGAPSATASIYDDKLAEDYTLWKATRNAQLAAKRAA